MGQPAFLGRGLLRPFRRDQKNDFANGAGHELVAASGGQVLGTRCRGPKGAGELPWRGDFGSRLHLLRHKNINTTTLELARHYSVDALRKWEPRGVVTSVTLKGDQLRRVIAVHIGYDVIRQNVARNRVVLTGLQIRVDLA